MGRLSSLVCVCVCSYITDCFMILLFALLLEIILAFIDILQQCLVATAEAVQQKLHCTSVSKQHFARNQKTWQNKNPADSDSCVRGDQYLVGHPLAVLFSGVNQRLVQVYHQDQLFVAVESLLVLSAQLFCLLLGAIEGNEWKIRKTFAHSRLCFCTAQVQEILERDIFKVYG